jgi:hypothetical protein
MPNFTQDLQNAEMWPIKAKGAVTRLTPIGDPSIEGSGGYYHQSLEDGRLLERNIGDAQHWLLQKKKDLMEKINMYSNMNNLAIDGRLSDFPRSIKYVYDSIRIVEGINSFQQEIIGLISAITQNIGILQSMELNLVGMVQQNLNALALTLNEICNWGLPDVPAIPNLFSDTIWHWNGFNFIPLGAFEQTAKSLKFDTNFAFNQCVLHVPNLNIFRNYPTSIQTYSGLQYGTIAFAPPLGGLIPNTGQSLSDPNFITTMQNTQGPYFLPPSYAAVNHAQPFNVNSSMQGAVPDPATIISNYHMPSDQYQSNIVSIVPALRNQTIEPGDADYANPNLTARNLELRKSLVHYVTLEQVVASNYDPNLTACWLFYLASARNGRLGTWIENFQVAYVKLVAPSITYLAENPTPWNCVLPGTTVSDAPVAIPLIATLTGADATTRGNLLWQLSYVEASLLGYTRAQDWDAYGNSNYVGSFTGTDLDYASTSLDSTVTTTVILGEGEAEFPTPCTFPSAMGNVLQQVIALADTHIKNTPTYTTSRPQFKFIYDQFAQAKLVDRFTQFWREFNANVQSLLLQDPYLIQFVVSYAQSLDSAIDPLGDLTIYNQIKSDAATRNRTWAPGYPLLSIPKAPVVTASTPSGPSAGQSGWQGTNFDPNVFLSRPDIQQLPIGTQIAMLRTNLSYAAAQQQGTAISNAIQAAITQHLFLLQDFKNVGWKAEVVKAIDAVPPGAAGLQVSFDQVDFDLTNNITQPNKFTVQSSGTYAIVVQLNWGEGDAAYRTGTLFQNSTVIGSSSTDGTIAGPTTLQMSLIQYLTKGDVLTVVATHGLATAQQIIAGSYISATLTSEAAPPVNNVPIPPNDTSSTLTFNAETALPPLTAVYVVADGDVAAIDPTTVTTDGHGNPVYPIVTGVTLSNALAGAPVTVGNNYGGVYEFEGSNFTVGGLLYAGVGGSLTQNYATVVATCQWVVVVGRAISSKQFIYEPHIPNLLNLGTF